MFLTKKKKIQEFVDVHLKNEQSEPFTMLLDDYLNGKMKSKLTQIGIRNISIHIDWLPDYKCIGIQGKYRQYYMDLQIDQEEFTLCFDSDEPDDSAGFPLENPLQMYIVVQKAAESLE